MRRSFAWIAFVALGAVLAGCPQDIRGLDDGGDGGGASTDGGGSNGGDGGGNPGVDAGEDGGVTDGGAQDGGSQDAGNPHAPLTWGKMTLPTNSAVQGISGRGKGDVYAGDSSGSVLHYDGQLWTKVFHSPSNASIRSVHVTPTGEVFTGGFGELTACTANCTVSASYITQSAGEITGVCGTDLAHVFATGPSGPNNNAGVLYLWDVSNLMWRVLSPDTSSFFNGGCWVSPSGTVFIAAQATIVRYENGVATPETIHFPPGFTTNDISMQMFETVWGAGDEIFAAGYRKGIIHRNGDGTWDYVQPPTGVDDYHALAGAAPDDFVVAGARSGTEYFEVFDGTDWKAPVSPPDLDVYGLYAADTKTYFAVGTKSGVDAAIYLGTRP